MGVADEPGGVTRSPDRTGARCTQTGDQSGSRGLAGARAKESEQRGPGMALWMWQVIAQSESWAG